MIRAKDCIHFDVLKSREDDVLEAEQIFHFEVVLFARCVLGRFIGLQRQLGFWLSVILKTR